jgi:pyridoxal phosphate enzyme (YggS family)
MDERTSPHSGTSAPAQRLADVRARIAHAARTAGRDPAGIELIAVSKTFSRDAVMPLMDAGQTSFGENRVQEAEDKWLGLDFPGRRLHLVGQLQSNKAAAAVRLFDLIHSVDRASLIEALAREADRQASAPGCFIQVNIGEEAQKGGCAIRDTGTLVAHSRDAGLDVVGLMCVPPADEEPAPYFALLAKMADDLGLTGLSMGMSGDFETAVMLGATHVRVGSALFGTRS